MQKKKQQRKKGERLIACKHLIKSYGGVSAVTNVSVTLPENAVTGFIGGNGAGKTTLFNIITGFEKADSGKITMDYQGREISLYNKNPNQLARLGLVRTFQHIRLFDQFTTYQNILAGALGCGRGKKQVEEWITLLHLNKVKDTEVLALPYGTKRLIELARALSTGANTLFLDEIGAGMSSEEIDELADILLHLQKQHNLTVVLIEHNMAFIQKMCSKLYAMDQGKIIAKGTPQEVLRQQVVKQSIIGE